MLNKTKSNLTLGTAFLLMMSIHGTLWANNSPFADEVEILKTKVKNRQDVVDLIGKPKKIEKSNDLKYSEVLIYRHRRFGTGQGRKLTGGAVSECLSVAGTGPKSMMLSPICAAGALPLAAVGTVGGWLLPGETSRLSIFLDHKGLPAYFEVRGKNMLERGYLDPEKVMLEELAKEDPSVQDRVLAEYLAQQNKNALEAQKSALEARSDIQQAKALLAEPVKAPQKPA